MILTGSVRLLRREMNVYKVLLLLLLTIWGTPAVATVTLGEIDVRSFLNQPLQAQINAQGSGVAEPDIEIRLASEEVYRRAGMVRSALPSDLDIQLEGTGTNRLVRLTTQRPVREPYLGLLLEARWSAGRIFREYTILLDPPVAFAQERSAAPVVTSPVQTPRPAPVAAPEPAPRPPARVAAPAPERPTFYTVRRGDTLGNIIRRQGYVGVSSEQAMIAILEANPQAFGGQNVNELRAGAELRLPEQQEVAAISDWEARQEIERQTRAWRDRDTVRAAPPAPTPEPAPGPEAEQPTAERAAAPVEEPAVDVPPAPAEAPPSAADDEAVPEVPEPSEAAPVDRLEILAETEDARDGATESTDMRIFQEALLSQQAAMASLRDELRGLRSELAERDQIIRVVNEEFAQLQERFREMQTQMRRQFSDAGFREGMTMSERVLSDPLLMALGGIALLLFLLLIITALRPARAARGNRFAEDFVADDPALAPLGPTAGEPSSSAPPPSAPRPASRSASSPQQSTPRRKAEPVRGAGAAAAAALVGAAGTGDASRSAAPRGGADAGGRQPTRATEKGPADVQNVGLDMDDDLLADVDLYLAYGMNDQAISALEHAIKDGHDGNEYRVRLMEAYAANNDARAARSAAADLRERLAPGDDDLRERIAAVEQRFRGSGDTSGQAGRDATPMAPEEDEMLESDVAWGPDSDSNALDFDSFDFPPPEEYPEEDTSGIRASSDDSNLLHFDLDEMDETPGYGSRTEDSAFSPQLEEDEAPAPRVTGADRSRSSERSTGFGSPGIEMDTSENGMRLSLAEAFAEMDDREGALALLDEIVPTATPEQTAKADELRRRIEGAKS